MELVLIPTLILADQRFRRKCFKCILNMFWFRFTILLFVFVCLFVLSVFHYPVSPFLLFFGLFECFSVLDFNFLLWLLIYLYITFLWFLYRLWTIYLTFHILFRINSLLLQWICRNLTLIDFLNLPPYTIFSLCIISISKST